MARPSQTTNSSFSELAAWDAVGDGWQRLHGNFQDQGFSIEWHDFTVEHDFEWARSFHPNRVEICLNLSGEGWVGAGAQKIQFGPLSAGYYWQKHPMLLEGFRRASGHHQFLTVELSFSFLKGLFGAKEKELLHMVPGLMETERQADVSESKHLTGEHQLLIASLRRPRIPAHAQRLWYYAKALEIAAVFFQRGSIQTEGTERKKQVNQERVQKVISILRENLAEPLSLEAIGRRVGCSQYHLSRIFTQEIGKTLFHYYRDLRMERAAELLREGKLNVSQVAVEVGYSSPSHFSNAFHATFGCCPGLYPIATTSQRPTGKFSHSCLGGLGEETSIS